MERTGPLIGVFMWREHKLAQTSLLPSKTQCVYMGRVGKEDKNSDPAWTDKVYLLSSVMWCDGEQLKSATLEPWFILYGVSLSSAVKCKCTLNPWIDLVVHDSINFAWFNKPSAGMKSVHLLSLASLGRIVLIYFWKWWLVSMETCQELGTVRSWVRPSSQNATGSLF